MAGCTQHESGWCWLGYPRQEPDAAKIYVADSPTSTHRSRLQPVHPPLAHAHPFLIDSVPPQGGNVPGGTTKIITYYSEAVEIDFSELKIYDSNGNQIDNRDTSYHEGEESLSVTTPPLEDGVYTIASKVLSKVDGHLVQAAIVFGVGEVTVDVSLLEEQD